MSSANGSIRLPDRLGHGGDSDSELGKPFESDYSNEMPLSERPVNKQAPTGRRRNSPF
jgi:hypothetical protein